MAPSGWRSSRSVAEQLAAEPFRFDLHQAIAVVERLHPGAHPVGEEINAAGEAVRFRSSLAAGFPASDLAAARPPAPGRPQWELTVNALGLGGAFGPLPRPFTEAVVWQVRDGHMATRDFLDIFNHRLISILHRGRRLHRPALVRGRPDQAPLAAWLYALFGLGTAGLRDRMALPDRALLRHAGLLAQQPPSAHGLERIVQAHFAVSARVIPLQGRWLPLDDTQTTRIGARDGRNATLGDGAVLGARVWDQQAGIVLELGPMGLDTLRGFLPGGHAHRPLGELIRFYAGRQAAADLRLRLPAAMVPATRLTGARRVHLGTGRLGGGAAQLLTRARADAPRLGWTTWLTTRSRLDEGVVAIRCAATDGAMEAGAHLAGAL